MNTLERDITIALNAHSAENESNTPDFILAGLLTRTLKAFNEAMKAASAGEEVAVLNFTEDSMKNLMTTVGERNTWYNNDSPEDVRVCAVTIHVGDALQSLPTYPLLPFHANAQIGDAP